MTKVILVYTNCHHPNAKGDFSFAANLTKELVQELERRSQKEIDVILTSTEDGMARYEALYGIPVDGQITVDGISLRVSSLEAFDSVKNTVIAYIDANRCKFAPVDVIKRVVSPECKFVSVGNANQNTWFGPDALRYYYSEALTQHYSLYQFFDLGDVCLTSVGFGKQRLGLPRVSAASELARLSDLEAAFVPKDSYGFMYLASTADEKNYHLIAQYMKLTGHDRYILVGNFNNAKLQIKQAYQKDTTIITAKPFPNLEYHQTLPNKVMRALVAGVTKSLVLSTGVTGTLEAMQDGKLTYYQDLAPNIQFVRTYLEALKELLEHNTHLSDSMTNLVWELSLLLFMTKPLSQSQMAKTQELLSTPAIESTLISANRKLIQQATGAVAPSLLQIIEKPRTTTDANQLISVCGSLRKFMECRNPTVTDALRRAAAWGRLFELKILIKFLSKEALNNKDYRYHYTALHCAVYAKEVDCARVLINAGADLNAQDIDGKTSLHLAVEQGNEALIYVLITAGASKEIYDVHNKTAVDYDSYQLLDSNELSTRRRSVCQQFCSIQ